MGKDPLPYGDLATQNKLTVILHDHLPDKYKCGNILVDCGNEDLAVTGGKVLSVPADNTWYVVGEHESVAFVNSTGGIEFVVIHGCCILCPDLIAHVNKVIEDVVHNWRGVWVWFISSVFGPIANCVSLANPWWQAHPIWVECWSLSCLCIWVVHNVTNKKLDSNELAAQDKSILGIMSLTWNPLTAALPKEVIDPVKEKLVEAGLPPMASPGNIKDLSTLISSMHLML
ncbi:hypothetical protein EDC04DRAFT_2610363 [Pisolithus marmoratus]|nr:hypothetical protein EDC04DRAFT_2610363 [Pisolithus marmoratus]